MGRLGKVTTAYLALRNKRKNKKQKEPTTSIPTTEPKSPVPTVPETTTK